MASLIARGAPGNASSVLPNTTLPAANPMPSGATVSILSRVLTPLVLACASRLYHSAACSMGSEIMRCRPVPNLSRAEMPVTRVAGALNALATEDGNWVMVWPAALTSRPNVWATADRGSILITLGCATGEMTSGISLAPGSASPAYLPKSIWPSAEEAGLEYLDQSIVEVPPI